MGFCSDTDNGYCIIDVETGGEYYAEYTVYSCASSEWHMRKHAISDTIGMCLCISANTHTGSAVVRASTYHWSWGTAPDWVTRVGNDVGFELSHDSWIIRGMVIDAV